MEPLAPAAADSSREVRVTVAKALGTLRAGAPLAPLLADPDPLVRAAALTAVAATGGHAAAAVSALSDPAWQVRAGAAAGLSSAPARVAVPELARALSDPNADVRKAAVLALRAHRPDAAASAALATAVGDPDADVRAYASRL